MGGADGVKNIDTLEKLHNELSNILLNKNIIKEINNTCIEYTNSPSQLINYDENEYTLDTFNKLYDDLISNKQIDSDKKLDSYNYKECLESKGSTETKYNRLIG